MTTYTDYIENPILHRTYIKIKRLERFGHVWRADYDKIKKVLTETIHKKRPIDRPRTRWKDPVEKDIKMLGRNLSFNLALDRKDGEDC